MKRTYQITVVVIGWLVGLSVAAQYATHLSTASIVALVLFAGVLIVGVHSRIGYVAWFVLALTAGLLRGQLYWASQQALSVSDFQGVKIEATGRVSGEPHWNDDRLYEFFMDDVHVSGQAVSGLLKVKSIVGVPHEGQIVRVQGKVGRALGKADSQIWYADVAILNPVQPYPIRVKTLIDRGLEHALARLPAAFAQGVLFGQRSLLPSDVQADTQATGLTHILAVSGYNLTIIVTVALIFWKRRTWPTVIIALGVIGFFVIMTGMPATVIRAAVMVSLVILIGMTRRELDLRVALLATVLVMTAWSPGYVYSDLGWQLSVLALAGVVLLAPALLPRKPVRPRWLVEIFVVALAAHLATAPLIMHVFGSFSLIAPLANLLVLPLIPLVMLGAFAAAAFGIFVPALAPALAQPISAGISGVLGLIHWLAHLPSASLNLRLDTLSLACAYIVLATIVVLGLRRHSLTKPKKV